MSLGDLAPRRILVVAVPGFGDVFLATALVRSLKRGYRGAEVDLLVRSGTESILTLVPEVDEIVTFDYVSRAGSYLRMVRAIFRKYDLAVSTSTSDRSVLSCVYAAPTRISMVQSPRPQDWWKRRVLDGWIELNLAKHVLRQNAQLGELLGLPSDIDMRISIPDTPVPSTMPEGDYVVLHPCSNRPAKDPPPAFWIKVAAGVIATGRSVVITGGPVDRDLQAGAEIARALSDRCTDLTGRLSFAELASMLSGAACVVGTDTCVPHLAAALGTPTVVIHGASNTVRWFPWAGDCGAEEAFSNQPGIATCGRVCVVKADCSCAGFPERCTQARGTVSKCLLELRPEAVKRAILEVSE